MDLDLQGHAAVTAPRLCSRRSLLLSLGGAMAGSSVIRNVASGSIATRRAEIDAMRRFAEATHPRGREARDDARWRQTWANLAASADSMSDGAYLVNARRALGWFGDGHTTILPFEFVGGVPEPLRAGPFGLALPLSLRCFDDGLYVIAASGSAEKLLGQPVTWINEASDVELMRRLALDWPGNPAWAQRWAGAALASPAQLVGLDVGSSAEQPWRIFTRPPSAARDAKGAVSELMPRRESKDTLNAVRRPLLDHESWASSAGAGNYVRGLDDGIVYVSIDDVSDVDDLTFESLSRQTLEAAAKARRVIIDLRRNGGGDNFLCEPLRRGLARSHLNRAGGLYVLIGPQTFSAAQNLATRLERETFARFIGTPTGGSPNHYGDAKVFAGSVTGITAIVSAVAWFDSYPEDRRPWIMPDVLVPELATDWLAGRDRALDLARSEQFGVGVPQPGDDYASDRVIYYARPSQAQRWASFWMN